MKSIEERAREYTHRYATPFLSGLETAEFEAYRSGATEQKTIDIDKAVEWFGNYLMEIGHPDDWMRDSKVQSSGEQRFRKAMEE